MNRLLIIQPGKFGDIIICLPIAKWYSDRGYQVEWECPIMYHEIFRNVDYVKPVENAALEPKYNKVLDLSFGFGGAPQMWWNERQMKFDSFVTAKYELAGVPLEERWNLVWNRCGNSEGMVRMLAGGTWDDYPKNWDERTILVHVQGSFGPDIEDKLPTIPETSKKIYFEPIENHNIFDWYQVIEDADEIHCIDSSMANFIEVVPEFKDKKKYLYDVRESQPWLKSIYKNGWEIVT